jgi:uncharacterized protein YbjT (DUF2867 family)
MKQVFIAGGTGYMGSRLIPILSKSGFQVLALARPGSEGKLPAGDAIALSGSALDRASYQDKVPAGAAFVHLVGTPRPSPAKAKQFREVDLPALKQSAAAAIAAKVSHFVFVSVAHPAPVMQAYIEVRTECEEILRESGLNVTVLRPWYVLGPGHWWPLALTPMYKLAELVPSMRDGARRLGLVKLEQMVNALAWSVQNPASGFRILEVPDIRDCTRAASLVQNAKSTPTPPARASV